MDNELTILNINIRCIEIKLAIHKDDYILIEY